MLTKPTEYQQRAQDFKVPTQILHWVQGSGKTRGALGFVFYKTVRPCLIICPKSVVPHWKAEITKHTNRDAIILDGPRKKRSETLKSHSQSHSEGRFFVVTHPDTIFALGKEILALARTGYFGALILDELNLWKRNSQRTKVMRSIAENIHVRVGLTGNLITENYLDFYNPIRIIHGNKFTGMSYIEFRNRYFGVSESNSFKYLPTSYGKKTLKSLFKKATDRVRIDETTLPEETEATYYFTPTKDQKVALRELKDEWKSSLIGQDFSYMGQILAKARQIVSGFLYTDNGAPYEFTANPRLDLLKERIEQLDNNEPIVIFVDLKHERIHVENLLVGIGRTVSGDWQRFNKGEGNTFVASYSKDARGIELDRSRYLFHYHRPWRYDVYDQSRFRIRRKTSNHPFVHHVIITSRTIPDQLDTKILNQKTDIVNYLSDHTEDLEKLWQTTSALSRS